MIDIQRRANALKHILEDEEYQAVLTEYESDVVAKWKAATTPDAREACHAEWRSLNGWKVKCRSVVDAGLMAERSDTRTPRTRRRLNKE